MSQHISRDEWMRYLSGDASDEVRGRVEHHIAACANCRESRDAARDAERLLCAMGARVRAQVPVHAAQVERSLALVLERAERDGWRMSTVESRLETLHAIMSPLCGALAARRVIDAATRRTGGLHRGHGDEKWPELVGHLVTAASTLCGDALGRLVGESASA